MANPSTPAPGFRLGLKEHFKANSGTVSLRTLGVPAPDPTPVAQAKAVWQGLASEYGSHWCEVQRRNPASFRDKIAPLLQAASAKGHLTSNFSKLVRHLKKNWKISLFNQNIIYRTNY